MKNCDKFIFPEKCVKNSAQDPSSIDPIAYQIKYKLNDLHTLLLNAVTMVRVIDSDGTASRVKMYLDEMGCYMAVLEYNAFRNMVAMRILNYHTRPVDSTQTFGSYYSYVGASNIEISGVYSAKMMADIFERVIYEELDRITELIGQKKDSAIMEE